MKTVKVSVKGIKVTVKNSARLGFFYFPEVKSPDGIFKEIRDYINAPPNSMGKALRGGSVFIAGSIIVPIALAEFIMISTLGIVLAIATTAGSPVVITLAASYDGMKWVYHGVDDLISSVDEVPSEIQPRSL